jgi:hypothetical protein
VKELFCVVVVGVDFGHEPQKKDANERTLFFLGQAFAQRRNVNFSADDSFVGSVKSLKASVSPVSRYVPILLRGL